MYLLTCGPMIKMKLSFSTSNYKIFYLTMLIDCRKNLSQSDLTNCKIITIEGEEKVLLVGIPNHCQCLKFNRNRRIGLQYAKV
jgi:hypothetical protein